MWVVLSLTVSRGGLAVFASYSASATAVWMAVPMKQYQLSCLAQSDEGALMHSPLRISRPFHSISGSSKNSLTCAVALLSTLTFLHYLFNKLIPEFVSCHRFQPLIPNHKMNAAHDSVIYVTDAIRCEEQDAAIVFHRT